MAIEENFGTRSATPCAELRKGEAHRRSFVAANMAEIPSTTDQGRYTDPPEFQVIGASGSLPARRTAPPARPLSSRKPRRHFGDCLSPILRNCGRRAAFTISPQRRM